MATRTGASPVQAVADRMNGFSADGIDGVESHYSSFVPSRSNAKIRDNTKYYQISRVIFRSCNPHSKFAVAQQLCAAQTLGMRAKKKALLRTLGAASRPSCARAEQDAQVSRPICPMRSQPLGPGRRDALWHVDC